MHVRDRARDRAATSARSVIGVSGTRVTVPLSAARLPLAGRLRALVSQLVQLRPILEDPPERILPRAARPAPKLITYAAPEPDVERPVLF